MSKVCLIFVISCVSALCLHLHAALALPFPPPPTQVFDLTRAVSNPEEAHQSNFLHPIVRLWLPYDDRALNAHWARGKVATQARVPELALEPLSRFPFTFAGMRKASEHHVIEDFLLRFDSEVRFFSERAESPPNPYSTPFSMVLAHSDLILRHLSTVAMLWSVISHLFIFGPADCARCAAALVCARVLCAARARARPMARPAVCHCRRADDQY